MTQTPNKLPHEIVVNVDGAPFTVFMSFALLNRVCYLMGDAAQVPLLLQDPELREAVLVECLALREPKGKVIQRRQMDEISVEFDDIQSVLQFVSEHVANFTIAAVEKGNRVMADRKARIDALQANVPSSSTATPPGAAN